ncbi:myotubularin-related protein 14 [Drosophila grimshawi]|uniref:GH20487 n=1 Tax=Drosophila grimshawi TaxID=7222 RepID=B4J922_DROGR|nr:myotubularin-related protein 14 [Drosophila grimshawi]EDW01371.1 GH20487 [Drosophila grimshawi]
MSSITLNEMVNVTQQDLHDLLEIFEKKSFEAVAFEEGTTEYGISKKCEFLFKLDYSLIELDNTNGLLSPRYPGRILIPEFEHGHMAKTLIPSNGAAGTGLGVGVGADGFGNGGCSTGATTATATPLNSSAGSNCSNGGGTGIINNSSASGVGIQAFVTFANPLQQTLQQPSVQQQQQQAVQQPAVQQQNTIYEDQYDIQRMRELVTMAKYARCRQRFAVPVIMYRGKYICRSATLSVMPETYGRKVVDYAYDCLSGNYAAPNGEENEADTTDESLINHINDAAQSQFSYDEVIKSDIQLLHTLNVSTIVDLMVENRKIKYFMAVSSSEKADPSKHYKSFNLLSLPYPGCEFFKKFRDNNYMAKNLHYNWKQSFNDANINIPNLGPAADIDIIWPEYRDWDLVTITQNYLRATLKYIQEDNSGLLIHCISGWDRTPLFVSLVRLSLWADGLIHQSLNALQMAYFTLAYDWYLFGHQLPDRLKRGEDIMFFCFHVLKFITDEEFSIVEHRKRTKTSSSSGSSIIVIKSDCCDDEPLKEDYILAFDQDSNDSYSNCSNCDMSITDNFYATTATTTTPAATAATTSILNQLTSRSPNPKRSRTSPISVPGSNARQRQESTSSNGSWQVVTDTGSIDSMINGSYMMRFVAQQHNQQQQLTPADNNIPMCNGGNGYHCSNTNNSSSSNNINMPSGTSSSNNSNNSNSSITNNTHGFLNGSSSAKDVGNGIAAAAANNSSKHSINLRKQRLNAVRAIFIQAYGKTIGLKFKEGSSMNLTTFIGNLADQLF